MSSELAAVLNEAVERFHTRAAVAGRLDISPARITRVLDGRGRESFSVRTCFRLAHVLGRSPLEVLRIAGKHEEAAMIGELCGPESITITDEERGFVLALRSLMPHEGAVIRQLAALALACITRRLEKAERSEGASWAS